MNSEMKRMGGGDQLYFFSNGCVGDFVLADNLLLRIIKDDGEVGIQSIHSHEVFGCTQVKYDWGEYSPQAIYKCYMLTYASGKRLRWRLLRYD